MTTNENMLFQGETGLWEVVIGLEVHAQMTAHTKLFSGAATSFAADPNSKVSSVDAAMPGMLPVLNEFCLYQAVKTGLGLHAKINLVSRFDRKNYFYPDLPAGYQITQFFHPIVGEGHLDIDLDQEGGTKRIGIERLHLEQDAGKSIHDLSPTSTFLDLNRAGTALMEIVTKPDLRSAEEVMAFMKKMRLLLRYLGTSDGNMEEGSMRADVNVSVCRPGKPWGTRAEIKNVNSIRFIGQAIAFEVARQVGILEKGGVIVQETRLFDPENGETRTMRSKEDAQDYRYHPEPDVLPVVLTSDFVDKVQADMPELPDDKRRRLMEAHQLSFYDASLLVGDLDTAAFYEAALRETKTPGAAKLVANWLMGELFATLNKESLPIAASKIKPKALASLVELILGEVISGKIAKDVFAAMWESGEAPMVIVERQGLVQIKDVGQLEAVVAEVMAENPKMVLDYRAGKEKLFGFFQGQVMKKTEGKANPQTVNEILQVKLKTEA